MAAMAFQVRVMLSTVLIARTPFASSPTGIAGVPSRVSSAVGSLRVPSLSLRRSMRRRFGCPSPSRVST
jgi:hypothetical protein